MGESGRRKLSIFSFLSRYEKSYYTNSIRVPPSVWECFIVMRVGTAGGEIANGRAWHACSASVVIRQNCNTMFYFNGRGMTHSIVQRINAIIRVSNGAKAHRGYCSIHNILQYFSLLKRPVPFLPFLLCTTPGQSHQLSSATTVKAT